MGKYMKKSKITSDVVIMELSQSCVRTRAKTLALQKLQNNVSPNPDSAASYLQLRGRRLEKSFPPLPSDESNRNPPNCRGGSRLRSSLTNSGSDRSESVSDPEKGEGCLGFVERRRGCETEGFYDLGGEEASFGENNLEFDGRGRSTRETTPCSFISDFDNIGTPGSTTRPIHSSATEQRVRYSAQRNIPTTSEIEEFFSNAEQQQQQRLFIEKYNFDFVNDLPLPGQYDWVTVSP